MIIESISAFVIFGIAILFLNPGHLAMPMSIISILSIALIIAFFIFSAFLLKEKSSDEREELHILSAGRISYLVGVGVLIIGIIIQTIEHEIDPWLVISLCAMLLSKLLSRMYSRHKM